MGNCLGNPGNDDALLLSGDSDDGQVVIGQDQPLIQKQEIWTSEIPLTDGALKGKRDTFWETAPVYDGRKEIWDALRAASEAVDEENYELAQAILSGANVSLPRGRLTEVYDELGNRYVIPKYCISKPSNMATHQKDLDDIDENPQDLDSSTRLLPEKASPCHSPSKHRAGSRLTGDPKPATTAAGSSSPLVVKVRLSTRSKDFKIQLTSESRVRDLRRKLAAEHNLLSKNITMLYSGRVLSNGTLLKDLDIPKGYIIQAIVRNAQ